MQGRKVRGWVEPPWLWGTDCYPTFLPEGQIWGLLPSSRAQHSQPVAMGPQRDSMSEHGVSSGLPTTRAQRRQLVRSGELQLATRA